MPFSDNGLQVGLAVAIAVAAVGFLVGTGSSEQGHGPLYEAQAETTAEAPEAPTYTSLRTSSRVAGTWEAEAARFAAPSVLDPVWLEGHRPDAIADRAGRRAFEGAPPTIPHPVEQQGAVACMACHEDGLTIRGRSASAIPHEGFTSCTQCHVVEGGPVPGELLGPDSTAVANSFVGLEAPGPGSRAWAGAPPVTPHTARMRENCESCHGPTGRNALKTPHPERQSCEQCHAPDAELNGNQWAPEP
jgi:cytochrome c-type protein NapB